MDLLKIHHKELVELLNKAYDLRLEKKTVPLFVHGTFGIGKTDAVRAFARAKAKELGLTYSEKKEDVNKKDVFLLQTICLIDYQAEELKGVLYPSSDKNKAEFLPLDVLPTEGQGVIFFDDFNTALPSVQSAAYQLIENRRVGGYKLPDGFAVVGAGNFASDGAYIYDMPAPLLNRFIHVELGTPTAQEWAYEYAINNGVDSRIIAYVLYKNVVHNYDAENPQRFPVITPRSLEKASILIRDIPDDSEQMLRIAVGSALGAPVAHEFLAWLKLSKKYNLKSLFKNRDLKVPKEYGELYSLILAIANYYGQNYSEYNSESIGVFCKILLDEERAEFAATLISLIKGILNDPEKFAGLLSKIGEETIESFSDILI